MPAGVDCALVPAGSSRRTRGVGTVLQHSAITGGHVVQGSAWAALEPAGSSLRQPWSHYLTRPGVVETLGRADWAELAASFAAQDQPIDTLNLAAVAARTLDTVQRGLARPGPSRLRSARTRLRWLAQAGEDEIPVRFALRRTDLRVIHLTTAGRSAMELAALCEDIALHDWLLTTLIEAVRKAAPGVLPRDEALRRLAPVIDYLLHLWMPDARGDDFSARVWAALEARPGFTRQWDTLVHRVRDQLSAGAVASLAAVGAR
jgi:hypothetical protein